MGNESPLSPAERDDLQLAVPNADFAMRVGVRVGDVQDFFGPTDAHAAIIDERRALLTAFPDRHSALLPEGEEVLEEALGVMQRQVVAVPPIDRLREMGAEVEQDLLLLRRDCKEALRLVGGCLCFPSSWSLEEKMGLPLREIHAVVPELNEKIGDRIDRFLRGMKPGQAWLRSNWGLSRSPDRNQHPALRLPELESVAPEECWVRVEHQALIPLPRTQGVLFGIRIAVHAFADVLHDPDLSQSFARQLGTIPKAMAQYKRIHGVREALLGALHDGHRRGSL